MQSAEIDTNFVVFLQGRGDERVRQPWRPSCRQRVCQVQEGGGRREGRQ